MKELAGDKPCEDCTVVGKVEDNKAEGNSNSHRNI